MEGVVQKSSFDTDILDVLSRKESMKGIEHILGELSQAMRSLPQDGEVVKVIVLITVSSIYYMFTDTSLSWSTCCVTHWVSPVHKVNT